MAPVRLLQIDIAAIGCVPVAVILERRSLAGSQRYAARGSAVTVSAVGKLVDVVAKRNDRVEIGTVRDASIDVEVAGRVVGAAHRSDAEPVGPFRERLGAANWRAFAAGDEPVMICAARPEASSVDLDREFALHRGMGGPAR